MLAARRIDAAEKAMNDSEALSAPKRINYRKRAFAHYDPVCARCAYGCLTRWRWRALTVAEKTTKI
jgi:hypothetical protein